MNVAKPQPPINQPPRPDPEAVWRAIDLYLQVAYPGPPPATIRQRLEELRQAPRGEFYTSRPVERPADDQRPRYQLRLGNRLYPHMKLTIDLRPDGQGYFFRADAHDSHCCPAPTSPEYPIFRELMRQNQQIVQQIEERWDEQGLPTFRGYLRDDIARRQGNTITDREE